MERDGGWTGEGWDGRRSVQRGKKRDEKWTKSVERERGG